MRDPSRQESQSASERRSQGLPLIERFRRAIRLRHYSRRTEKAYWQWIRRLILFHGKRHPVEMGAQE